MAHATAQGPVSSEAAVELFHIPVYLRVNVLDIQNVGNDNRFKLKLYFECCWDVARANHIVEELAPQEKGNQVWGLLGVKDYAYKNDKVSDETRPKPMWDPNVFFPNLIEVSGEQFGGSMIEWDQYDDNYENEKWDWNFWKDDKSASSGDAKGCPVLGIKPDGTETEPAEYYDAPNPPLFEHGKRRMFSRRVIATVTFKYETDLRNFPMDQQELWLYVRSRHAERLSKKPKNVKVILVQNPHVRSVMEQTAFSHSGRWNYAMSRFYWSRISRLQIKDYEDDGDGNSAPCVVPHGMLVILARREVDIEVRVQSVLPFFFFLTMAFGGLFIPVKSIDQRMGFFSSLSISVFTYMPDIHPRAHLRTLYEEHKIRVLSVLVFSIFFTAMQYYTRLTSQCEGYDIELCDEPTLNYFFLRWGETTAACYCMEAGMAAYPVDKAALVIIGIYCSMSALRIFMSLNLSELAIRRRAVDPDERYTKASMQNRINQVRNGKKTEKPHLVSQKTMALALRDGEHFSPFLPSIKLAANFLLITDLWHLINKVLSCVCPTQGDDQTQSGVKHAHHELNRQKSVYANHVLPIEAENTGLRAAKTQRERIPSQIRDADTQGGRSRWMPCMPSMTSMRKVQSKPNNANAAAR